MSQKLKFTNTNQSSFFATARLRVEDYFKENNISRHANGAMWFKTIFFLTGFLVLYLLIMSNQFGIWSMVGLAALLGAFSAFIGFNICHDAIHGSFSRNKNVNKVFSLLFNFIGANPYVWSISHNIVHHSYTNIPGHDEDIEIAPGLVRISEEEKVNKLQRFQHYYAFLLYGLASLSWVTRKDFLKFFQKKIGQHPNTRHPRKEYFNLFFYKGVYYFLFIVLPLLVLDIAWWQFMIGFLWMHFVEGLVLGLVFQLAHVVEGTAFPTPNEQGNLEEAWAEHQMLTTANFSPKSKMASFLCGGLNRQIEHHLFPKICHIHYPAISVIVKEVAQEFNLPYLENPSFLSALKSHYRLLKKLGKEAYALQTSGMARV
ncbi:fatty acid desaturase family protein [Pontibacter beigongshangensis]|uniref:fatty acid desaturase family protein n=1 Tax=Pontibacter beigongshangensis TaxID=2574733 RepID=UPI00164F1100|nr:acyl-CoA desaturase [Pontibacter beigongshangensis]